MNTKKFKVVAIFASLAILFVMLFSTLFMVKEANHNCSGQDCPICDTIREAEGAVRTVGTAVVCVTISVIIPSLLLAVCLEETQTSVSFQTLISQKVRLND